MSLHGVGMLRGNIHLSNGDVASLQGSEHWHTTSSPGVAVIPNPNSLLVDTCLLALTYIILCLLTHILVLLVFLA